MLFTIKLKFAHPRLQMRIKYQREMRSPHLEPYSTNFCKTYHTWTIQQYTTLTLYAVVCKRHKLHNLCFCRTVCYPLINPWNMTGKHSGTNLSSALKMDYFFHVMFCVYNKEIIPLMKNRLEPTLKHFTRCNRIPFIITSILQLHYTITPQLFSLKQIQN